MDTGKKKKKKDLGLKELSWNRNECLIDIGKQACGSLPARHFVGALKNRPWTLRTPKFTKDESCGWLKRWAKFQALTSGFHYWRQFATDAHLWACPPVSGPFPSLILENCRPNKDTISAVLLGSAPWHYRSSHRAQLLSRQKHQSPLGTICVQE